MFLGLCSHPSQKQHGCCFRSNVYKDVCRLRWRTYRKRLSESLEHLASDNGVICINITRYTPQTRLACFDTRILVDKKAHKFSSENMCAFIAYIL